MIVPRDFTVENFLNVEDDVRIVNAINAEALTGSELIDNLILLKLCDKMQIHKVLSEVYHMEFAWLRADMTPPEYREIADKHHVLIEKGRSLVVYIPLGQTVDDALLQIDIPNYPIMVKFIADCNYRMLRDELPQDIISLRIAPFRPLLVFRRIVLDCMNRAGTDVHFQSTFVNMIPTHRVRYRIKKRLVDSEFQMDFEMMERVIQAVIGKLTPTSSSDIDATKGIVTNVRDLFRDGSTTLRITCNRVEAGYYVDFAIQNVNTTTRTIDKLGFPNADVDTLRDLSRRRTGLTLVTGEMRSGKNTTIFAMVNEIIEEPIRIVEYSNPIENHMDLVQYDYHGDTGLLKEYMKTVKKQDVDIAILNEIPDASVAFAVRDLVNSAIGVITTTHINRLWHLCTKLREFYGNDYKTVISQLNAVINHKMFCRWSGPNMQKRALVKEQGAFELFCYRYGVRQYFVPQDISQVTYELQPLAEILVITDAMKSAILNFDEIWKGEQMLESQLTQQHGRLEEKVAQYVNAGIMSLEEMRRLF